MDNEKRANSQNRPTLKDFRGLSERIALRLFRHVERIHDKINNGEYPCIHSFCYDLCELFCATQVLLVKNEIPPVILCDIENLPEHNSEDIANKRREAAIVEIQNILKDINWHKDNFKGNAIAGGYCIPMQFDEGGERLDQRVLIIYGSPIIGQERRKSASAFYKFDSIGSLVRLLLHWVAVISYGRKIHRNRLLNISQGADDVKWDEGIKAFGSLLGPFHTWPFVFRELVDTYKVAWQSWLRYLGTADAEGEAETGLEESEVKCTMMHANKYCSKSYKAVSFWFYAEDITKEYLCLEPEKCRLGKRLCDVREMKERKHIASLIPLIKWTLLYSAQKYNFIQEKGRKGPHAELTENRMSFLQKHEERSIDGNQRITLSFR